MTTALDWTLPMPDHADNQPAASPPLPWWRSEISSPIVVIALASMLGAGLTLWREQPAVGAGVAGNAADIATLKADVAALQRSQMTLEADNRSNKEQLAQMRDTLQEIKSFNAATMREMTNLNVQFAEIRGGLAKEKRIK